MAEFQIKNVDDTHADPDNDLMGCFKRGDIIEISPDGGFDNMPWITVLKVPGLNPSRVQKLCESHWEPVQTEIPIDDVQYQSIKNDIIDQVQNDRNFSLIMRRFTETPTLVSQISNVRLFRGKVLTRTRMRRFQIPSSIMDVLFPVGVNQTTITKLQFVNNLQNCLDKTANDLIKNTAWWTAFKNAVNS